MDNKVEQYWGIKQIFSIVVESVFISRFQYKLGLRSFNSTALITPHFLAFFPTKFWVTLHKDKSDGGDGIKI